MPKKTKKEKIIADYRKRLKILESRPSASPSIKEVTKKTLNFVEDFEDKTTTKFFYNDFMRSLIIIIFILTLEIGLYFARIIK